MVGYRLFLSILFTGGILSFILGAAVLPPGHGNARGLRGDFRAGRERHARKPAQVLLALFRAAGD